MKFIFPRLLAFLAILLAPIAHAQVNYSGGVYSQNFNSLPGTTNNTLNSAWTNNSTLAGWYASNTTFSVTDGTVGGTAATFDATSAANNVGLFSFGAASSTDRALGSRATSQVAGNDPVLYGVRLVNNTTQTLTRFTVTYTGEQWFASTQSAAHTLLMDYQFGATSVAAGTWTGVTAGTFTAPISTGTTARALVGNTTANRTIKVAVVTGISWAPGQELWVRFRDANESGNEQALAVDDFSFLADDETGLFFNGSTSYVTMGFGTASATAFGASSFTVECRFLRTGPGATASTGTGGITANPLVAKGVGEADATSQDANYFLGITAAGRLVADFEQLNATNNGTAYLAGQNFPITGSITLLDGVWYHVAATYNTTTASWKLYVNGVEDTAATQTIPTFVGVVPRNDSIQGLGVGTTLNSTGARSGFFNGIIDEVRIWNVARAASDILNNKDVKITTGTTGLLARYGFDENTGTTAAGIASTSTPPAGTLSGAPLPIWTNAQSFASNIAPTVSLTAPADGSNVTFPATIDIAAEAADSDGTIAKVEFYNGATKIGEDTTSPYTYAWIGTPVGTYSLTAVASDNGGKTATSTAVSVTVAPNSNQPPLPTASSPANNAAGIGSSTTVSIGINDPEGDATTVTFYGRKTAPTTPGPDFTVATLPDTQFYSENLNNNGRFATYYAQTQWLVDNRDALNLAFVSHMGDIVQNGDAIPAEWVVADTAMKKIENQADTFRAYGIPWGGAPGNHDQTSIGNAGGANLYYNQTFGINRFLGRNYWGGSQSPTNNNNNYQLFSASGLDFIIIHLEYDARAKSNYQAVLDWADALLKANPNRRAIVTSHWIVNTGNPATFSAQGQDIYDELKDNPNLFLLLCGHVAGEGQRTDTFQGRAVHSVLQDYQGRTNGGDGWLRYFIFSPANNTISARTYRVSNPVNPAAGSFETDTDSQFTLAYNMQNAVTDWIPLGTVNVPANGSIASIDWTGLEAGANYEWYASVNDGINSANTASRRFSTTANVLPIVSLDTPANNTMQGLTPVSLSATASDSDGTITKVEFYDGGTKLGEDASSPYAFSVATPLPGAHAYTAIAIDNLGASTLSSVVNVTITNTLPAVTLTEPDSQESTDDAPANTHFEAIATDADGSIAKVEFYANATKVGEVTTAQPDGQTFIFDWLTGYTGNYALTAKAYDNYGAVATSTQVRNLTVTNTDNVAPTVALTLPVAGSDYAVGATIALAATGSDTDGTIAKIEFYQGATKLGEDLTAPFTFSWVGATAGVYSVTAVATDSDGGTANSTSATITVSTAGVRSIISSLTETFDSMSTAGTSAPNGWSMRIYSSTTTGGNGDNTTWSATVPIPGNSSTITSVASLILNTAALTVNNAPTANNNNGYNAQGASASDRVLATAPTTGAGIAIQAALRNNSGSAVSSINLSYDIRRYSIASTANELPGYWLFYSLDGGTTWTNVAALNPTIPGPSGVIIPNTTGVTNVPTTPIPLAPVWANGSDLLLRWVDDNANQSSPDQIIGLDNVAIQINNLVGVAPLVQLTSPANNASANAPASFSLAATASDSDGTITKVEFYAGATKLGEDTTDPYTYDWMSVVAGSYSLTARATDSDSNVIISAPVVVTSVPPPTITRGPYLNSASQNSIVIRWRSSVAGVGRVRYGTSVSNLDQITDETASVTDHEVKLTGLSHYTRYYYSVGTATYTLTPETAERTTRTAEAPLPTAWDYTFRTSPTPGTAVNTRIWIVGDCGRDTPTQAAGRDAYYTSNFTGGYTGTRVPDLNLQMGDNAYNSGTDAEYTTGYFNIYTNIFRKMPQWSTLGNHDANNGSTSTTANFPYFDMFTFPVAGECGGVASGTERYYSFNYGNIHFICLDSQASSTAVDNPATTGTNEDGPMATWLRADLAANTATWTIAFWHHPPYSKGSHDSDTEGQMVNMRTNFNPILEAGGVDLLYFGHSHNYERSVLLNGHYGISSTITSAMKLNAGNGSVTGYTIGANGIIRNAANGYTATATTNGTSIAGNGSYLKPLTGPRDNFGAVYNTAGSSGQADGGSLNHSAMYISYNTVGTVNLDVNGNTLTSTYIQSGGTAPDNFTITKQGAADSDGDGISDEYEIANGLNRKSATDVASDLDGDGLSARVEFALNTSGNTPNRADLPIITEATGADSGKLTLTFTPRQATATYIVQASDDLKTWTNLPTGPIVVGSPLTVVDPNTASPNRYLRLAITVNGVTESLVPTGRIGYSFKQNQETSVSFPLCDRANNVIGHPAGFINNVTTNTLEDSTAGWAAGALSNAVSPYFVRITKGAAAGLFFPVSTSIPNTANSLTLVTAGVDLTTLGIVINTDTYELIPAHTLGSLFPAGTLLSGNETTGDTLRLWNGSTFITYYHDGTNWMRSSAGNADNLMLRPDQGWMLLRRGATLDLEMMGDVASTVGTAKVTKRASSFVSLLPISQTFAEFPLQTLLPNWSSNIANVTAGDYVRIWNGASWLNYYYNGSAWMRQNAGSANTTQLLRPGRPIFIVRPSGTGSNTLTQPKTY